MSLESLLSGDYVNVREQNVVKDASAGITASHPYRYTAVPARVKVLSAVQQAQLGMLLLEVSHTVFTKQAGIVNGDMFETSDTPAQILRVTGIEQVRGMGGIPTYYRYHCIEVKL